MVVLGQTLPDLEQEKVIKEVRKFASNLLMPYFALSFINKHGSHFHYACCLLLEFIPCEQDKN